MEFNKIISDILDAYLSMAPYLVIGLIFAGVLKIVFKKEFIIKHLGGNSIASVIKAAVLGVPLPLCSCGVLPTAMSLKKSHASNGATLSFLISTPQTGVDSILATYGMLGPVFAFFRPFAALVMGIVGGLAALVVDRRNPPDATPVVGAATFDCVICDQTNPHTHGLIERLIAMARYAFVKFLDDISVQLAIGIVLAGLITFLIPADFFLSTIQNEFLSMLLMIGVGMPMYVCATASIPIAAALMGKGLSAGAAFVFLAAGPATNAATMMVVGKTMGNKMLAIYLGTIGIMSIVMGYALNGFNAIFGVAPVNAMGVNSHHHGAAGFAVWEMTFSYIFLALLAASFFRILKKKFFTKKKVCEHCQCR